MKLLSSIWHTDYLRPLFTSLWRTALHRFPCHSCGKTHNRLTAPPLTDALKPFEANPFLTEEWTFQFWGMSGMHVVHQPYNAPNPVYIQVLQSSPTPAIAFNKRSTDCRELDLLSFHCCTWRGGGSSWALGGVFWVCFFFWTFSAIGGLLNTCSTLYIHVFYWWRCCPLSVLVLNAVSSTKSRIDTYMCVSRCHA